MGFISFKTVNGESIRNAFSPKGAFKVFMIDHNNKIYPEFAYQGYGVFGKKDFFILIYEMNTGKTVDLSNKKETEAARKKGIRIYNSDDKNAIYPIFSKEIVEWKNKKPESCEKQGYYY